MLCGFCCHAAMDARKTPIQEISHTDSNYTTEESDHSTEEESEEETTNEIRILKPDYDEETED